MRASLDGLSLRTVPVAALLLPAMGRGVAASVGVSPHIVPSFTGMYPIPGGKETHVSMRTLAAVGILNHHI